MAAMQAAAGVIAAVIAVGVVLAGMSLHLARGVNALRRARPSSARAWRGSRGCSQASWRGARRTRGR